MKRQIFQPNEYFELSKSGKYELWQVDTKKGFPRCLKTMDQEQYRQFQAERNWTIRCRGVGR